MDRGRWFFRAVQRERDWACHRGRAELDRHPSLHEALLHLEQLAADSTPSEVFAHFADGRVESVFTFD